MGDLFHALPVVHNLKVALDAKVDWVVGKEYVPLVECFEDVDKVIPFYRRSFFSDLRPFMKEIRAREYELVVDLQGLFKSGMVSRLARTGRRIGPSFLREGAGVFYSDVAGKLDKDRHAVDECMDVVRHLGLPVVDAAFPVTFPKRAFTEGRPRIAMLPRSRWFTKNWPARCFVDLVKLLQPGLDPAVFLIGGPDDVATCDEIANGLNGNVTNLAGKTDLVEMGSVLQEMDLLVSNDSGPVHMAAAIGTTTVVVFGPTNPERTGPYGEQHVIVKASLPCQPCYSRTCNRDGVPCLEQVTPEHVAELVREALGRNQRCL